MLITKFYLISKASQELWKAVVYLNELFKLTTFLKNSWWALKLHKTVNNNIGLVRLSPWYEPKIGRGTAEKELKISHACVMAKNGDVMGQSKAGWQKHFTNSYKSERLENF